MDRMRGNKFSTKFVSLSMPRNSEVDAIDNEMAYNVRRHRAGSLFPVRTGNGRGEGSVYKMS